MQSASPARSRIARAQLTALLTTLRCVSVAPFGAPVVPEVNWTLIASFGRSPAVTASRRQRWPPPPRPMTSRKP